jgi:VanZ family protein
MIRLLIRTRAYAIYLLTGWIVIIIVISSVPSLPSPRISTGKIVIRLDYLFHLCEYGALAVLAFLSFAGKDFNLTFRKKFFITLFLILFSVFDELHQKLIPGRSFNPRDILSNISGIMTGLVFCILFFRKIANHLKGNKSLL